MAPTQEQKRMQIARKKRIKLERQETNKAKQNEQIEATLTAVRQEASRQKDLAIKYYSLWKESAKQHRDVNVIKLKERKRETVCSDLHCIPFSLLNNKQIKLIWPRAVSVV